MCSSLYSAMLMWLNAVRSSLCLFVLIGSTVTLQYVCSVSMFVSLQEQDSLALGADPSLSPYQGHNAFREKYFSGVNKRSGKEENKPEVNGE